ncbi:hypothetical protein F5Y16DRAFT_367218 [Xylariaceae sp. FL0255]|nr:hypothetical protein F5Y16DRAFT_367218 [Xylariaceae sp. FL0255]
MPSVKNPNGPSKNRLAARKATARKHSAKSAARASQSQSSLNQSHKITKADSKRGARAGILPTSGPNAAVSGKKARKLARKMGYALKRKMEAEGEVEMKDVDVVDEKSGKKEGDETMAGVEEEIS